MGEEPCGSDRCLTLTELESHLFDGSGNVHVEEHLASCPECRDRARELREDDEFLRSFRGSVTSDGTEEASTARSEEVPGYRIVRVIGRGGQGIVYEALQISTGRRVALKVLLLGLQPGSRLHRFEREIQLAAALRHPHVVTVFDSGTNETGRPFLAMELIEGLTVVDYARKGGGPALDLRETLLLFGKVCAGVGHAHRRGVIHRDLKPGNILVDRDGQPRVLDFGLAKMIDSDAISATRTGAFLGTLSYAAPEQLTGDRDAVDMRTDVHALGVILYEILTGRHPFEVEGPVSRLIRSIGEDEPPPPSRWRKDLDSDVDTVVLKALAKEPDRRYGSAAALEEDLRRYLAGEPIVARRDSTFYLLRKIARRHRLAVAGVAMAILVTLVLGVWIVAAERRAREGYERSRVSAALLQDRLTESEIERGRSAGPPQGEEIVWDRHLLVPEDPERTGPRLLNEPPGPLQSYWALSEMYSRNPCLAAATLAMPFGALRFVEGGEALVIVGTGGEVVSWKPGSGRGIVRERELPFRDTWPELTEGARLVCGMKDGVARIFDRASGEVIATVEGVPGAEGVVLSPDGEVLTVRRSDRSFALLEVPSLRETAVVTLEEEILGSPWFSPDRKSLLLWTRTGFLLFDRSTRDEVYMRQPGDSRPRLCAGSADGRTLLVGVDAMDPASQYFQAVAVFHRQGDSWREEARISGGFIGFSGLDTTSSGNLAVAGDRQRILVYDLEAKDPGRGEVFHGHRGAVRGVVFSPDARTIASVGSAPDVARIWESHSNRWFNPYRSDESRAYLTMAFSPDGRYLAAAGCMGRNLAGVVDVLDARTRERRFRVEGPVLPVAGVRFSPEGRWLVAGSQASDIHVWDLSSGEPVLVHRFETESRVNSVSATATLVVAGEESGISVWDLVRGEEVARYQDHAGRVPWIEFDPPGRTFLTVSSDGKVLRRALEGGVSRIGFHGQTVRVARFSPDGSRIVSGCDDGAIRIWNANGGAAPVQLVEHRDRVFALAFHPGGRLLASGDASGVVHLWDATRGLHLAELQGHQGMVMALEFSPDGGELWSSSHAGMLGCWDLDYYEKHLRGNVMRHLERLRVRYELDPEGVERWMQWVREEEVTAGSR